MALIGAGSALAAVVHSHAETVATSIVPGRFYAVSTDGSRAEVSLPQDGGRYLLIVSSLGRPEDTYRVTLRPVNATRSTTGLRLLETRDGWSLPQSAPSKSPEACAIPSEGSALEREFSLHIGDGALDDERQYARVASRLVAEGIHARVYLDSQLHETHLQKELANEIVAIFDRIVPEMTGLGRYRDIDGDGKFCILLTPWLSKLQGGQTRVSGFVRSNDFAESGSGPFSNRCDMLYLNSDLRPGGNLNAILVHEYTHAVCFSERLFAAKLPAEEDWLSEAVAHVAETKFQHSWSNLDHRVARYLNDPQSYPLVVEDYYRAGLWRCHGSRGATYLFLRWCVDRFGDSLLTSLLRAPCSGPENLEWVTGVEFEELYREWTVSLASDDALGTFDVRGNVGRWGFAGPRVEQWDVIGVHELLLRGTSTAYVEFVSEDARAIAIDADSGASLQVTVQKIPTEVPRIHMTSAWNESGDDGALIVSLSTEGGASDVVEFVACECNTDETHESICLRGDELEEYRQGSENRFAFPRRILPHGDAPLVVKSVIRDANGRRAGAHTIAASADGPKYASASDRSRR